MGRSIGRWRGGGVGDVVASSLKCSLDVDDPDCQRRGSRDAQTDGERERERTVHRCRDRLLVQRSDRQCRRGDPQERQQEELPFTSHCKGKIIHIIIIADVAGLGA